MNIKINVVNDKFLNISPMAFGNTFVNLSEFVEDETPEKTFENIGVLRGKTITDLEGFVYKVLNITEMNSFENRTAEKIYKVDIRRVK